MECEYRVEFAKELVELDQRCKSNTHRLDKIEQVVEAVYELTTSVRLMADQQKRTADAVNDLDAKLTNLEQKPAKRWEAVVEKIIVTIVAALIGYALARVGLT